eukprot:jgi/Chlat1/8709/Chrsp89S08087
MHVGSGSPPPPSPPSPPPPSPSPPPPCQEKSSPPPSRWYWWCKSPPPAPSGSECTKSPPPPSYYTKSPPPPSYYTKSPPPPRQSCWDCEHKECDGVQSCSPGFWQQSDKSCHWPSYYQYGSYWNKGTLLVDAFKCSRGDACSRRCGSATLSDAAASRDDFLRAAATALLNAAAPYQGSRGVNRYPYSCDDVISQFHAACGTSDEDKAKTFWGLSYNTYSEHCDFQTCQSGDHHWR